MAMSPVKIRIWADTRVFERSFEAANRAAHGFSVALMRSGQRRRHVRRCRLCRPFSNPRPLRIDGHAYHRHARARRRRR